MKKNKYEIGNLLEVNSAGNVLVYMRICNIKYDFLNESYTYLDQNDYWIPLAQVIRVVEKSRPKENSGEH